MKINRYTTVSHATKALRERGFRDEFKLVESGKMKSLSSGKEYGVRDMKIVEYHRFEGLSNPGDMSIVFAVECTDGNKGTIISSYGMYADIKMVEFMDKVKIKEKTQLTDSN